MWKIEVQRNFVRWKKLQINEETHFLWKTKIINRVCKLWLLPMWFWRKHVTFVLMVRFFTDFLVFYWPHLEAWLLISSYIPQACDIPCQNSNCWGSKTKTKSRRQVYSVLEVGRGPWLGDNPLLQWVGESPMVTLTRRQLSSHILALWSGFACLATHFLLAHTLSRCTFVSCAIRTFTQEHLGCNANDKMTSSSTSGLLRCSLVLCCSLFSKGTNCFAQEHFGCLVQCLWCSNMAIIGGPSLLSCFNVKCKKATKWFCKGTPRFPCTMFVGAATWLL